MAKRKGKNYTKYAAEGDDADALDADIEASFDARGLFNDGDFDGRAPPLLPTSAMMPTSSSSQPGTPRDESTLFDDDFLSRNTSLGPIVLPALPAAMPGASPPPDGGDARSVDAASGLVDVRDSLRRAAP